MKKIMITGGNGLFGTELTKVLKREKKYEIHSLTLQDMDITNVQQIEKVFSEIKPEIVIHAASLTDVDYCETHEKETHLVNVTGTENIVKASKKYDTKIIYISTDYIFDGKNGPYTENDNPNPLSVYAKTKWEGEKIIQKSGLRYLITRTTILYGGPQGFKQNFVTFVVNNLRNKKAIFAANDQYGTPTYVGDLSEAILFLLDKEGIYNVVGRDYLNRYEFARLVAEVFGLDKTLIQPVKTSQLHLTAPRPLKVGLKIDKLVKEGFKPHSIKENLIKIRNSLNL